MPMKSTLVYKVILPILILASAGIVYYNYSYDPEFKLLCFMIKVNHDSRAKFSYSEYRNFVNSLDREQYVIAPMNSESIHIMIR